LAILANEEAFIFGVATFDALPPGVCALGTLPPILATDCLAFLLPLEMAFEADLTPPLAGVFDFFPPLAPPETLT